jgi:ATP-dependent Clp protease ATP-binding subunit ClpX
MDREDTSRSKTEDSKIPDQKELEKELSDYLSKKYGDRVKIISPFVFPKPSMDVEGKHEESKKKKVEAVNFSMKPEELEAYLDEYVIKQDRAKAILATKICTHFNRIKRLKSVGRENSSDSVGMIKNNIILLGPTGVGKTYIIKLIAQKIGVPFVKGDATKFSETGYVGGDVEDLVRDLVYEADDDIDLAQYGIVYIDEIDKIASSHNLIGPDVSRSGVQRALLKLMEETDVDLKVAHDPISQIQAIEQYRKTGKREKRTVNTRHILFIVSGAFGGLNEIIRNRLHKQDIGFRSTIQDKKSDTDMLQAVKTEDFINYGFESEFIGRLPVHGVFEELTADDLYEILRNPNNPVIISKKRDFQAYGIDVRFEDKALRKLAKLAFDEKTGARGLVSVVEQVLIQFEKKLPSTDITELLVTSDIVDHPDEELEKLLADPLNPKISKRMEKAVSFDRQYLRNYLQLKKDHLARLHGLELDDLTMDLVTEMHLHLDVDVNSALREIYTMQNEVGEYELSFMERYGFKLSFTPDAFAELVKRAIAQDVSALRVCENMSKEFDYAFRLIKERTGKQEFTLDAEAVRETQTYLNNLIKKYYSESAGRHEEAGEPGNA